MIWRKDTPFTQEDLEKIKKENEERSSKEKSLKITKLLQKPRR